MIINTKWRYILSLLALSLMITHGPKVIQLHYVAA